MNENPPFDRTVTSSMGYLEYTLLPVDPARMPKDLVEALSYWQKVRGDHWAPTWGEFKLFGLPLSIIPMTVVVDVDGEDPSSATYVYRFWGTQRAELYGRENMGREIRDALPDKSGPIVADQYGQVLKDRGPVLFKNVYPYKPAYAAVCITLRLPIASPDRTRVEKIVALAVIVDNTEAFVDYVTAPEGYPENDS